MGHRRTESAQVAVVGGSLAGATCALELARKGISVILLERTSFPRRKACGEGLSYLAGTLLAHLGLDSHFLDKYGHSLYGYRLQHPAPSSRHCSIRRNTIHGWGVSRADLDTALTNRLSIYNSATCIFRETVRGVTRHKTSWEVTTQSQRIVSEYLVLASGANPQAIARTLVREKVHSSGRVGISIFGELRHCCALDEVVIIPFNLGELYVTPLRNNSVNVSVVGVPEFIYRYREPQVLQKAVRDRAGLQVNLGGCSAGAANFSSCHQSLDTHLYLVGDAHESFDPLCGLGMTHALASGIDAARAISNSLLSLGCPARLQADFQNRHNIMAASIRRYSRLVAGFLRAYYRFPGILAHSQSILGGYSLNILSYLAPVTLPSGLVNDH